MRLIDADKLYKYIDDEIYTTDKYAEVEDILNIIAEQPGVLYLPNNATNGDLLLKLLAGQHDKIYPVGDTQVGITLDCDWWNAPYRAEVESEDEE